MTFATDSQIENAAQVATTYQSDISQMETLARHFTTNATFAEEEVERGPWDYDKKVGDEADLITKSLAPIAANNGETEMGQAFMRGHVNLINVAQKSSNTYTSKESGAIRVVGPPALPRLVKVFMCSCRNSR